MYDRTSKKVVIDAGHGGSDPGALSGSLKEKNLNLEAAQYMYDRLNELGIPATIVRDKDETLDRKERVRRILNAYGNDPNVILISNHINAGGGEGAEVVYALRNSPTLANLILDNIGEAGQVKRKAYQRRLPENPNKDYYFIIRDTTDLESLLVEYGFIDNAKDAKKLQNNLTDFVEGTVKALTEYIGVPYTAPGESAVDDGYYIVKKGDSLYKIARLYNTTIEELKKLNNITSDVLKIGQKLLIAEPLADEDIYIVQKGDTLYSIATKLSTTVNELMELNNLTSTVLSIGDKLLIPKSTAASYQIYKVQKGDSLWSISQKYNIPVNELIALNNLTNLTLQIGDELKVPNVKIDDEIIDDIINPPTPTNYIVQKGDTLWSIAKANNVTVAQLKEANNLTSNLLTVGDTIIIPTQR